MNRNRRPLWMPAGFCTIAMSAWLALPATAQTRGEARRPDRTERQRPAVEEAQEQGPPESPRERPPAERPRPELHSVRFEATVFQVQVAKERVADMDAQALTGSAATPGQLAKALQEFGSAQIWCRVDETLALGAGPRNRIELAKDVPYITGVATTPSGQQTTSVARQKVATQFDFQGWYADERNTQRVSATLQIGISSFSASSVRVGPDVAAPVFWQVQQSYSGVLQVGQPAVLLTVDGGATAEADKALAFVTLIKLSEPGK